MFYFSHVFHVTFTLKNKNCSTLSADFFPPIQLDPSFNYSIGLIGFYSFNSIPNVEEGVNNKFYYIDDKSQAANVTIPTGTYEITDIEKYIQNGISGSQQKKNEEDVISIKPNNNTLKCELFSSKYDVDFTPKDSLADLLGFDHRVLAKGTLHRSHKPINIIRVNTVRIECNIAKGCYHNSQPSHTIFEFVPGVDPGYAINIEPSNHIYLPIINKTSISNITVNVVDQNSNPVDFREEEIIVRLELKKDGPNY